MTVLLADDDKLLLEDVRALIPWESNNLELVGTSTDGGRAFDLYCKLRPRLLILDIAMPTMDGLTVAQKVRDIDPTARIIFLSGHRDFNYARKAVELRADSYVLKHEISDGRLLSKLLEIRRELEIDDELRQRDRREALSAIVLMSSLSDPSGAERLEEAGLKPNDEVLAAYLEPFPLARVFPTLMSYGAQLSALELEHMAEHPPAPYRCLGVLAPYAGSILILFAKNASSSEAGRNQRIIERYLADIQTSIRNRTGTASTIAFAWSSADRLPSAVHELRTEYPRSMFAQNRGVFCPADLPIVSKNETVRYELRRIERLLHGENSSIAIPGEMKNVLYDLVLPGNDIQALADCVVAAIHLLSSSGVSNPETILSEALLIDLADIQASDAETAARCIVTELQTSLVDSRHFSNYTKQAIHFMRDNYRRKTLSVSEIAESINVSESHLRSVFRGDTGITMNQYITEYRISRAIYLLRVPGMKVYEVAERVGFASAHYLATVFRKVTGKSPIEARYER